MHHVKSHETILYGYELTHNPNFNAQAELNGEAFFYLINFSYFLSSNH